MTLFFIDFLFSAPLGAGFVNLELTNSPGVSVIFSPGEIAQVRGDASAISKGVFESCRIYT